MLFIGNSETIREFINFYNNNKAALGSGVQLLTSLLSFDISSADPSRDTDAICSSANKLGKTACILVNSVKCR